MKNPPSPPPVDDCDDIFGPPRTYPGGYCPPKTRPSMISAKYRQKEERRKILKISANKLKKIEDPEISLHRSVLINNIMRHLQQDARDERYFKNQLNYPRFDNDHFLNIKNEFIKNESKSSVFDDQDFDTKVALEMNKAKAVLIEENLSLTVPEVHLEAENNNQVTSPKRTFDDDCDVQDVLSQCYMPPTPRMLTKIDDSEDDEPVTKKPRLQEEDETTTSNKSDVFCVNEYINNSAEARLRFVKTSQTMDTTDNFSCGHASMFSDLQNNVYHNLIASLET
ncbi:unnamed protein product [Brassicogethes aeneus]|uniref:SERTA domain-containing protein n=1 Tax=Brassicogethes aeneus TaxID=1431903 RepID=A0A9P0FMJ7_BRAAE|nr:unnamed protein product [Brassicogethes aeneus]